MAKSVRDHYQQYPYPHYPLLASVRRCDTYALNLHALWLHFNGTLPPPEAQRILIAGCGTFAPYPWAVANPTVAITALDLSSRTLQRAAWHCRLHGRTSIDFRCANILDRNAIDGSYGIIDSYGVLHHLEEPLHGLQVLASHLAPGGIIRVMLYSRYARRDEESIRRALKLLGITTPHETKQLLRKAVPGSRLHRYIAASDEHRTVAGLADALLHPCVHTYRIDEILDMVAHCGLVIHRFGHHNACENPADEIARLRLMETERHAPDNFVLYLGLPPKQPKPTAESLIILNPCLTTIVGHTTFGTTRVVERLGCQNPPLTARERKFLRQFTVPVALSSLNEESSERVAVYKRLLFLLEYTA
jgi:SAM-dependent methyltransferase